MKELIDNKIKIKEIILWLTVLCITLLAFYLYYAFNFAGYNKIIIWLVWLILCMSLVFFTAKGKQLLAFSNGAKIELQKVVWPTRQEAVQTTLIVMVMVAITGFILWGIDSLMMWGIAKLTHLG